ncbi:MAG: hypothetical protein ABJO02_03385 [Reichenbachiella sp.]|uniref:hypothetical protein n=1 Tax=Reichenbachiella sp. TaxID=2184521 RepID=UPI00329897E8
MIGNNEGKPSVDSLKIRFNLDNPKLWVNPELLNYWFEVNAEGEIDTTTFKRKRMVHRSFGCTTSYAVQKRKTYGQKESDCLIVMVNSKILGRRYFDGITINTIGLVYDELMKQNMFSISIDHFYKGAVTDVDIKTDFKVDSFEEQCEIIEGLKEISKSSQSRLAGYQARKTEKNCFISWSNRDAATNAKPFVKLYAKDIELRYNSNVFCEKYIGYECDLLPVMRTEVTIKNKAHFKYLLNIQDEKMVEFNLNNLLLLNESKLLSIVKRMSMTHVVSLEPVENVETSNFSLADCFAMGFLDVCGSLCIALARIEKYVDGKDKLYRAKKKLRDLDLHRISEGIKPSKSRNIDKVLRLMGVGENMPYDGM